MNVIKEWALGITLISFAGGIAFMLLPKGGASGTVKSVISVLIILSCVSVFSGGRKIEPEIAYERYFSDDGETEISRTINRQQLEFVEDKLKNEVEKILKKYSAEADKIYFDDNIESDGRIVINKIKVYLQEKYSHLESNIHDDVLSVLGIENEVIISDGSD